MRTQTVIKAIEKNIWAFLSGLVGFYVLIEEVWEQSSVKLIIFSGLHWKILNFLSIIELLINYLSDNFDFVLSIINEIDL